MALTLTAAFFYFYVLFMSLFIVPLSFSLAFVSLSPSSFFLHNGFSRICMSSLLVSMLPPSSSSFFRLLGIKAVAAALHGNALAPLPPAGRTDLFVASLHDTAHRRHHGAGRDHHRGSRSMMDPFNRSPARGFSQGSLHLLGTITFPLHLNATAALTTALTRAFAGGGGGGSRTHGFPSAHLHNAPTGGFLLHEGGVFGSRGRGHFFHNAVSLVCGDDGSCCWCCCCCIYLIV